MGEGDFALSQTSVVLSAVHFYSRAAAITNPFLNGKNRTPRSVRSAKNLLTGNKSRVKTV